MILRSAAASGLALGLAGHLFAQILEPPIVSTLRLHVFGYFALIGWLWKGQGLGLFQSIAAAMTFSTTYLLTLTSSIAVYRLYLHRLCRFPGETIHTLSMFSWIQIDWQGKRPTHLKTMHDKYGPVVRTGPRELSIANYTAASTIYGSCLKGPWCSSQSASPATSSLQSETSPSRHTARRNKWESALSENTFNDWSTAIISVSKKLLNQLNTPSKAGIPVDIAEYLVKFSLDSASLLAIGTSLDLLDETFLPPMIAALDEGIRLFDTVGHVPYLIEAVRLVPSSTREFDRWVSTSVQSRIEENTNGSRVNTSLTDHLQVGEKSVEQMISDASLFIKHSSDATKRTLIECIRELIKQPLLHHRLEAEIQDTFAKTTATDYTILLKKCPFLNACINETLRLFPPVPNGSQRVTPSKGLKISEKIHLPGNIIVSIPTYTLHRDAANFSFPDEFDPTRWLATESKATTHRLHAYQPFGDESMGCVGKELALMQCRIILARLFQSFTITPVEGEKNISRNDTFFYTLATEPFFVKLATK